MFPENTLAASEKILQMIHCKCEIEKPCSRKSFSCSQAQLSCFMFFLCYGNRCYNTWTISEGSTEDESNNEDESEGADNADKQ